jgi:hypothetical protein
MKYKVLTEIGYGYKTELGTSGERNPYLAGLENRLKKAITLADQFRKDHSAAGPQVASGIPAVGSGRVRALVAFHQEQQENTTKADILNAEVIRMRQWIVRQGAKLTLDGRIIWPLSAHVVEYDTQLSQRNLTRIEIRGGMLCMTSAKGVGKPLDTKNMATAFSGPGYAIYVMSREGHIHVSTHAVGYRHHSSLLAGEDVAAAGELQATAGRLVWISNKSGHYQPNIVNLLEVLHELQESGVPMTFRVLLLPERKTYPNVDKFLKDNGMDDAQWEVDTIWLAYSDYLSPEWLRVNQLAVLGAGPHGRAGIYDLKPKPPRRLTIDEFERNMIASGMPPIPVRKSGAGR